MSAVLFSWSLHLYRPISEECSCNDQVQKRGVGGRHVAAPRDWCKDKHGCSSMTALGAPAAGITVPPVHSLLCVHKKQGAGVF